MLIYNKFNYISVVYINSKRYDIPKYVKYWDIVFTDSGIGDMVANDLFLYSLNCKKVIAYLFVAYFRRVIVFKKSSSICP